MLYWMFQPVNSKFGLESFAGFGSDLTFCNEKLYIIIFLSFLLNLKVTVLALFSVLKI